MPFSDPVPRPIEEPSPVLDFSWEGITASKYRARTPRQQNVWEILEEIHAKRQEERQRLPTGERIMPLKDPTISAHVDEGRYLVELVDLADSEVHPEYGEGMNWYFKIFHATTEEPVTDDEDNDIVLRHRTSTATGPKSKARPWIEALMGRQIQPTDTGAGLMKLIVRKRALALIGDNERGYSTVLSMSTLKAKKKKAADEDDDQ